ncbi:MAG: hypothetical protein IKB73_07550 [Ruminococcus sp.]|nr:hypothetical protein [Ruminococcus sp.]
MNYDHVFDSSKTTCETKFELGHNRSEALTVFFQKENIVLKADANGNALFLNSDGDEISREKAQSDRLFGSVYCSVKDDSIIVNFPVTKTIDHYPHCDGEYDRYSEIIVDNIIISCPLNK